MQEENTPRYTPIEHYGDIYVKRDDLYRIAGVSGGKVRALTRIARGAAGLVTGTGRGGTQMQIVARFAARTGRPARLHTATGPDTPEMADSRNHGAKIIQHRPGYTSVIEARAAADAAALGWCLVPYGMSCPAGRDATRGQVADIPPGVHRIVISIGSGTNVSGVLWGLQDIGLRIPVLGICVGGNPRKRIDKLAPPDWRQWLTLEDITPRLPYATRVAADFYGIELDQQYEAKVVPYLSPHDLFWIVGIRAAA